MIAHSNARHVVDLLGYQNLIVQSQLKCRDGCWAVYDWQFRQKASAVSVPEWSVIDITLLTLAFTSQGTTSSSNDKGQYRTGVALAVRLVQFGLDHFLEMPFATNYIPSSQLATLLNSVALI